jgi:hypothetical protein
MMNYKTAADIRNELHALSKTLITAQNNAALYEQLKAASGEAARITKRCSELTDTLAKVREAEAKAERVAAHAPFKGMTITEDNDGRSVGLLSKRFIIQYTTPRFNHTLGHNEPVQIRHNGFGEMTDAAFRYMMEAKPELIPHAIMQLAPDNAQLAFERYFVAQRRGYLVGTPGLAVLA